MNRWGFIVVLILGIQRGIGVAESAGDLPPHPRLLYRRADIPRLRREAAGFEWKKKRLDELRSKADDWLSRAPRVPDRGGGWAHEYCCPTHGAELRSHGPGHTSARSAASGSMALPTMMRLSRSSISRSPINCGLWGSSTS
jgi:hypothetical protein